ncbi:tyrosine-protein kinase [uncultured Chryseobacterium sp.]|uniref:GumC family protein n=1 Tax=uncultured Chryseobacterium sp. TaxID=259322 RepID=UPI002631A8EB|nr:tyrosine-protein kinase [uncultured Chryseobacterium sp.]
MTEKKISEWDEFEWEETEKSASFADFFFMVKRLLPWIVICALLGLIAAWIYYKKQEPQYVVKSKILIKDESGKSGMKNADVFMDLGLFSGSSSVDNELEIITTYSIMEKVVNTLNLNTEVKKNQFIKTKDQKIYDVPWNVNILNYGKDVFEDNLSYSYTVHTNNGKVWIESEDKNIDIIWNKPFTLPVGTLVFQKPVGLKAENAEWILTVRKPSQTVEYYIQNIQPVIPNKNTSIITLEMKSPNPQRDKKVMNKLIDTYIAEGVKDNNSINDSTMLFINERLAEVTGELRDVEGAIQNFKQRNQITNIDDQVKVLLESTKENSQKLIDAEIQHNVASALENHLRSGNSNVIPSGMLTQDASLSAIINQYNALVVQKEKLGRSATPDNPLMKSLNGQIGALRSELIGSIASTRKSYGTVVNQLRSETGQNLSQIRKIPQQEREYLDISRQQAIKQELYLFLLKKREETALGKSSTLSNTRVIDYARVVDEPVSPKRNMFLLAGLLTGALIPFVVSFIRRKSNTKIQTKNDIKKRTQMPIIGEIGHQVNPVLFEVKNNPRSPLAEQFRILRTNLHFYQNPDQATTVMVTSSMPGEGKTFISLNLAATLAANKEVKVLVIGMDLRKPRLATELHLHNEKGFSDYAVHDLSLDDIIYPVDGFDNLKVIPSGTIPPNPSELLMSKEAAQMFEEIKKQFDFIVIDCPPAVVTDYQIIGKYADLTLFTTRVNHTDKRQLEIADELFRSGKLPKMNLVVNDFNPEKYDGYNSGYYYQYGYYQSEYRKPSWWKKILTNRH